MSEKLPTGPFGPLSRNRFGKPGTARARWALGRCTQTSYLGRPQEAVDPEAGGQHEHLQLVQLAIRRADPWGFDARDRLGHKRGVRSLDGLVEVVGGDEALARRTV